MLVPAGLELRQEARMLRVAVDGEEQARRQEILKDKLIAHGLPCLARSATEMQATRGIRETNGASGTHELHGGMPTDELRDTLVREERDAGVADCAPHFVAQIRRESVERPAIVIHIRQL